VKVYEVRRPNISKASYVQSSPAGIEVEFEAMDVGDVVEVRCLEMTEAEVEKLPDDFLGW